ncbi:phage tail sheath subtilisin-like domain-containing protein [Haliangium sp.]|uniref:phage tail sheath subtilisin-like domain-containing protein n=1 Tax=Haliangium sp. TaxID=2663208 RepID=UPI003D0C4856
MTTAIPGVSFQAAAPAPAPSPLRSDVAGFVGRTRRGPVGVAIRVVGWRGYEAVFGGLDPRAHTPYAIRGYFENGGQIAYVVRVTGDDAATAVATWDLSQGIGVDALRAIGGFEAGRYTVAATSPGRWARDLRVDAGYQRWGPSGSPQVSLAVRPVGEPVEHLPGLSPAALVTEVAARSRYIRLIPGPALTPGPNPGPGPNAARWQVSGLALAAPAPSPSQTGDSAYAAAALALGDVPEVALLAFPDLYADVAAPVDFLSAQLDEAERLHDRMVVVDPPPEIVSATQDRPGALAAGLLAKLAADGVRAARAGALYFPYLLVPDPLAPGRAFGNAPGLRALPACGHVAGLISRLDRERGAHHTPANARLTGAVGLDRMPDRDEQARLIDLGVNLVRCHPRDGLVVWGGRTLARAPDRGGFIAHRRLLHRLVRAIRRVAEPLVFETNGPELWLAFGRAITTVLLSAFRSGALRGARPEQAFRVQCDAETNPVEDRDLGRCLCLVELAPAAPMEFIELRIALSQDGALEVLVP